MKTLMLASLCLFLCAPLMAQPVDRTTEEAQPTRPMDNEMTSPHTVKLAFHFEPKEADDKPLFVLSSGGHYGITTDMEDANNEIHIRIEGILSVFDDNKVLILFDSETSMKSKDGNEGTIAATGSAHLLIGKPKTLTAFGDRSLVVEATLEDEK